MCKFYKVFFLCCIWSFGATDVLGMGHTQESVIYNISNSDNIEFSKTNVYNFSKNSIIKKNNKFVINFDENSYNPTLIHFYMQSVLKNSPLVKNGQTLLEEPVLVILPGDSVAVKWDKKKYEFEFSGSHQVELALCKKIWKSRLSLSWLYFEMDVPATKVPLNQFLQHWYQLKLEGETLIDEIRHTPNIRPAVAAFLVRQIRLRVFSILVLPASYQLNREPLRVLTDAYNDSVAVESRILLEFNNAPATSTDGFIGALHAYIAYQCVRAGHYPTWKYRYIVAKKEYTGFHKAWLCFFIIEDARLHHQNISWLLGDYQRWIHPYDEFVRALKGDPTVQLRSYKGNVFADSLIDVLAQKHRLNDVLSYYKGQVVLIDLWASWCIPCLQELPASVVLANKYRSKGVVVLFLSIDKDPAEWRQTFRRLPKSIRNLYCFTSPTSSAFLKELEITAVPHYVLIDRHGQVRYPDALRPSDERLKPILEKLLKL